MCIGTANAWQKWRADKRSMRKAASRASPSGTIGDDRHGDSGDANELTLVIDDFNAPDMGGSAQVVGSSCRLNEALAGAFDVIGIDLHAKGMAMSRAGVISGTRANRLGHQNTHTTVQTTKGLHRFFLYSELGRQKIIPNAGELDAHVLRGRALVQRVDDVKGDGFLPNLHDH